MAASVFDATFMLLLTDDLALVPAPPAAVAQTLEGNPADTWANVWSHVTIPSVWEILVLHTAEIRAELLRRGDDGTWPDNPLSLKPGDTVKLTSIEFAAPLVAFYHTA